MPAQPEVDPLSEANRRIEEAWQSRSISLDLSKLGLDALPTALAELAELQSLDLSDNRINVIPDSLATLTNLDTLDIPRNQISVIPDSLASLEKLRFLTLSGNQIRAIPDSLASLEKLRFLDLADNQIGAVPDSLARLANLHALYLSQNEISTLPDSFAGLAGLRILSLSSTRLSAIPDAITRLADLQRLYLMGNQIRVIPDTISRLANLQGVYLSMNQIAVIPDSLARLINLQTLDLSDNQIGAIPGSLMGIKRLTELYLHGNPQLGLPEEILGPKWHEVIKDSKKPKLAAEILEYYFSQQSGSQPLNEAKLIFVGRGEVGKTSLVKALTTGKFNQREKTTQGIRISDWPCPVTRKETVTVHIWDFGGQEMMHATHQLFLTARSLYLLVLNRRQGDYDAEADYWFRMIRAFGGTDAPVIVVLNKQKGEPFDVNRGGWLEKYAGNIKAFAATDCADAKSISRLQEEISRQLSGLESLKTRFPSRWFAIKDRLAHMQTDFVTFDEYRAICKELGEVDVEAQNSLSGFLNDLGIALNYRDDPRLRFAHVLKPEWVTNGIYALLHAFVGKKGLFQPEEAEKALADKGYSPEAAHFILGLMERFELGFPLGDRSKRILIPELLDDQQPDMARDFKIAECLNFGYRYPIIPAGLLPRFIVRTHHLSEAGTRWKSGVILRHPATECRALVRADATERQVRIHIDGRADFRRELLAIIRHNFDVIHADYGFTPDELVYPPGAPGKELVLGDLVAINRSGGRTVPVVLQDKTVIVSEVKSLMTAVESPKPELRLFLSYSHKDEKYVDELRKALKLMERNGLIRPWYDRELSAGEKWEARILQELSEADIIVCQISRDFLASDFCVLNELDTAIRRHEAGEAQLIAYMLKDCGWKSVPKLSQFQILPRDAKPISKWKSKDEYWQDVAQGIENAVRKLQNVRPARRAI
jgi:internalin A